MELLQKIDIKTADSTQKRIDIQAREKPSNTPSDADEKPFKEQLSEQAEQLNSQMNVKKDSSNQEDTTNQSLEDNALVKDTEPTIAVVDEIGEDTIESAIDGPALDASALMNELPAAEWGDSKVAAAVIDTGKGLPLTEPLAERITLQKWALSGSVGTNTGSAPAISDVQAKAVEVDVLMQNTNKNINKLQPLTAQDVRAVTSESVQQKPQNIVPALSATLLEKSTMQDVKFTKMTNELSTTDVISQAAKLQQVPITTAVSASLSSAQKLSATAMSASLISDTAATPSQPVPLTNSPLNTLNASISASISNPNWSQQMTQQVAYMVNAGVQQAQIKLNPAHLGPMEIKLAIKDDQANINFVTQHVQVRDALDAALPRLKEMLEQQGLNLADADVSTQSEQREANSEKQQSEGDDSSKILVNAERENSAAEQVISIATNSGVSVFA